MKGKILNIFAIIIFGIILVLFLIVIPMQNKQQNEQTSDNINPTANPVTATPEASPIVKEMTLTSSDFSYGNVIPAKYTCKADDINPQLSIENVPGSAQSLALIVDDPDAPSGIWVHWVMWNIEAQTSAIAADSVPTGAIQGKTSFGDNKYGGPCPPSGTHRYYFKLYALDTILNLSLNSGKNELLGAMDGHILAEAELMGTVSK